jgi:hypothetical protein
MTDPHITLMTPLAADSADYSLFMRVEQALGNLPGPWKVGLARDDDVGWMVLSVFREDGFECTLFLEGPLQQTVVHIRDRLADALQRHMVGASRPRDDETKH